MAAIMPTLLLCCARIRLATRRLRRITCTLHPSAICPSTEKMAAISSNPFGVQTQAQYGEDKRLNIGKWCRQRPSSRDRFVHSAAGAKALDVRFTVDIPFTPGGERSINRPEICLRVPPRAVGSRDGVADERGD